MPEPSTQISPNRNARPESVAVLVPMPARDGERPMWATNSRVMNPEEVEEGLDGPVVEHYSTLFDDGRFVVDVAQLAADASGAGGTAPGVLLQQAHGGGLLELDDPAQCRALGLALVAAAGTLACAQGVVSQAAGR